MESEVDSLTVEPMVTTTNQLTASGANGCENTRAITVVVNDIADAYVDGILNICPGASTTLTVQGNGVVSYLWNDSVTTATRTVSPTETTTYSVLLTHNSGCQKQLTVTVKVGEPLTPIVSVPAEMCLGEVITFTAVFPDGTDAQLSQWSNG